MKLFVISDVHSFYGEMMSALNNKGFDINNKDHHIVVCGDLFDRGPDANKVFNFVKQLANENRLVYVRGNHEDLLNECVDEIIRGPYISRHHISNGTFDTVVQFTGMSKFDLFGRTFNYKDFTDKICPFLDFINQEAVEYAQCGQYIFTHGWLPTDGHHNIPENWHTHEADWIGARWHNGMEKWHKGARLAGKTVFCGHWHCSWGHSHLNQDRKEFPAKNRVNWQESFEPFVDEGIVAIDSCVAYTGFCNCVVVEVPDGSSIFMLSAAE